MLEQLQIRSEISGKKMPPNHYQHRTAHSKQGFLSFIAQITNKNHISRQNTSFQTHLIDGWMVLYKSKIPKRYRMMIPEDPLDRLEGCPRCEGCL